MKNSKPKGKTPSLIGSTLGTPRLSLVGRKSTCKRCQESIPGGIHCYEIPQLGNSFTSYSRYCDGCFASILQQTKKDLEALFAATAAPSAAAAAS